MGVPRQKCYCQVTLVEIIDNFDLQYGFEFVCNKGAFEFWFLAQLFSTFLL